MADDAGPLLERAGLIANEQLRIARQAQTDLGGTVGEHLVLQGFIDDEKLTAFFRQRLMVPRVDPRQLENIPKRVIARIPKDMADEFRVVPVAIDKEQNLIMAMSDPSNTHAVDEITFFTGAYVVRACAAQREIARALARYYGVVTPLAGGAAEADQPPSDIGAVRRAVMPPMTSPPSASDQRRAVRISEIVPALREAKQAEAKALEAGRFQKSMSAQTAKPAHARTTVKEMPVHGGAPDPAEDDTRPIARVEDVVVPRVSQELPQAVAGEIESVSGDDHRSEKLAAVIIEASDPVPKAIVDDEAPILLDKKTRKIPAQTPADAGGGGEEVVVLRSRKRPTSRRRRPSKTRAGVGDFGDAAHKLPVKKLTAAEDAEPKGKPKPKPKKTTKTKTKEEAREARTARLPKVSVEIVEDDGGQPVPVADENDTTSKFARADVEAAVDDGWGAPGSTIPPAYLGAYEADDASSPIGIPVPDVPDPEEVQRKRDEAYIESVHRLSSAMDRLEAAAQRDEVIAELTAFLAAACKRTAFFTVSRGVLKGWSAAGAGVTTQDLDHAILPLDKPSTFQDIVATRLPFHGPVHDAVSRDFLLAAVGASPGDMTALPISVRGKVVGIVFGDDRTEPIFDEHLTTLARSAGEALERIIATRKTMVPG